MDPRDALLSWLEVDADAFAANLASFRARLAPETRLLTVVKANAYGHGLREITRLATGCGSDALGVHALEEAAAVRGGGWGGTLLVMGPVPRARLETLFDLDCNPTVFDRETVESIDRIGRGRGATLACHLKLETGTNRQGVTEEALPGVLEAFRGSEGARLTGLSTHFANIEDTTDHDYAEAQLATFAALADRIARMGFAPLVRHTACTAAILTLPATDFDLVRLGIGAYGIWPSRETLVATRLQGGREFRLHPVLTWKARVTHTKWVPAGSYVGYGLSHRCSRRTQLGVIPVGYADGYDRGLSGLGHVLVGGQRAPVLGRICMNLFIVDLTDLGAVGTETEAVLLGRQGAERVAVEQLAAWCQTIPYEILARISPALPRLVVDANGDLLPS